MVKRDGLLQIYNKFKVRYSHKVFIYRRRFQLLATLVLSALTIAILLVFIKLADIPFRILLFDLLASTIRVVAAYLISLVLSIFLALVVTKNRVIEDLLLPILDVLQSFPSFAILQIDMCDIRLSNPELYRRVADRHV